jgi:hypothetical protein
LSPEGNTIFAFVFENSAMRIFELKEDEATEGWRKLHN